MDCVEARRAVAALALALTVADLSSLFRDVLCLLVQGWCIRFYQKGSAGKWRGRESVLWDKLTALRRGEEVGAGTDRRGRRRPRQGEPASTMGGGGGLAARDESDVARCLALSEGTR